MQWNDYSRYNGLERPFPYEVHACIKKPKTFNNLPKIEQFINYETSTRKEKHSNI